MNENEMRMIEELEEEAGNEVVELQADTSIVEEIGSGGTGKPVVHSTPSRISAHGDSPNCTAARVLDATAKKTRIRGRNKMMDLHGYEPEMVENAQREANVLLEPRKRKGEKSPIKKRKYQRRSSIMPVEVDSQGVDLGSKEREEVNQKIDMNLKNHAMRTFNVHAQIASLVCSNASKNAANFQKAVDLQNNEKVEGAKGAIVKLHEESRTRPCAVNNNIDAEKQKQARILVEATLKSMDDARTSTVALSDLIQSDIMTAASNRQSTILPNEICGYWGEEDGNEVIFIHKGAEYTQAYKALCKRILKAKPGRFLSMDEMKEKQNVPQPVSRYSTQVNTIQALPEEDEELEQEGSQKSPSSSQSQPTTGLKYCNPYAYVYLVVLDRNSIAIDDSQISLYKSHQREPLEKLSETTVDKIVRLKRFIVTAHLNSTELDKEFIKTTVLAKTKNIPDYVVKIAQHPMNIIDNLIRVMKTFKELDTKPFLQAYITARRISHMTADSVITEVLDGLKSPKEGIEYLKDHSKRPYYILRGKLVPHQDAKEVEERLELSKINAGILTAITNNKKRLSQKKLKEAKNKSSQIIRLIEHEWNPPIAFSKVDVRSRPQNNGSEKGDECCAVGFVTFTDLKKGIEINDQQPSPACFNIFTQSPHRSSILFVTGADHSGDSSVVSNLFKSKYPHMGSMFVQVECMEFKNDGLACEQVRCVVVGGSNGREWSPEELKSHLECRKIGNFIQNWLQQTTLPAITANLALNRIVTSLAGEELEVFKKELQEQTKVTDEQKTFERAKSKKSANEDLESTALPSTPSSQSVYNNSFQLSQSQ